jgi:hypothetical protein
MIEIVIPFCYSQTCRGRLFSLVFMTVNFTDDRPDFQKQLQG